VSGLGHALVAITGLLGLAVNVAGGQFARVMRRFGA
jgi:hypothetical protein